MRLVRVLIATAFSMHSALALCDGFGIRFIVDDTSLLSLDNKDRMIDDLRRKVLDVNEIYKKSEVDLQAKIVDITFSRFESRDLTIILEKMRLKQDVFTDFVAKANSYKADFTVAIVPALQTKSYWNVGKRNICGAAHGNWIIEDLMSVETAYAVINPSCRSTALAHELAHLMGVNHGIAMTRCFPAKKERAPMTPYAYGYSVGECDGKRSPEKFGDVMTGGLMQYVDGSLNWLNIFSNPRLHLPECGTRGICGDPETGDAARALNENARYFVKYR